MAEPLIRLTGLRRAFPAGEGEIVAVKDIDLAIAEGEMVAIIGASGSGKSTLMNLLGCLDQPTAGSYRIAGREVAELDPDAQARLRREYFGFIFQRYHLLGELTAIGNVEMPAIYAGMGLAARRDKAARILDRLGMAGRFDHRPGKLSGGQQQRVSIARALINDARIILADEPTGALDSQSGGEVLRILDELHAEGRTIIIVTHDMDVARRAERIIEIRDGAIVADRPNQPDHPPASAPAGRAAAPGPDRRGLGVLYGRLREAFRMAVLSMLAHKMRTLLTMLGIIIGIASVVSVVALGTGSQKQILSNIASLGTNTLEIFPGKDFGDMRSGKVETLVVSDADVLARQPYAAGVTPTVTTSKTIRFGNIEASAQVNGVGDQYFTVRGAKIDQGTFFGPEDVKDLAQSVVIDDNARQALFSGFAGSPVGQVIFVGDVPCRIVGVMKQQTSGFGSNSTPSVYLPYTTVQGRILGDFTLRSISLRVADSASMAVAEQAVTDLLTQRHRTKDFFILNTNDIRDTITSTTETMTLLVAAIAVISLIVGGIGVMNIMLVSVSERISEIGVRMAVGARRSDILQQFLIEATLVCLIGGFLGISAALGFGFAFNQLGMNFKLAFSGTSIVSAVLCSTLIGMVFGYLPARNASLLDPVDALTRD